MSQTSIAVQRGETPVTAALRTLAGIAGWCVTHTTDGQHAPGSLHYSGRAVDLAAWIPTVDSPALDLIAQEVLRLVPLQFISELIWAGPHPVYVKNGRHVDGLAVYGADVLAGHHNHVHLGVVPGFIYHAPQGAPVPDPAAPPVYKVNAVPVSISITPSGHGYLILCADGGVFAFGDAEYHGRVTL